MKLHWSPKSPYVRKVMIAAAELGLEDRFQKVRSVAYTTQPNAALMADNPLNKIPTAVLDDGSPLYDSLVICLYLDSLHEGPKLAPDGPGRWRVLQRHALANGVIDLLILWRNERERPEANRSEPHLQAFALKVDAALDRFEAEPLELVDQRPDLAEITLACALGYADFRFPDLGWRTTRPKLSAWMADFETRPSFASTAPALD